MRISELNLNNQSSSTLSGKTKGETQNLAFLGQKFPMADVLSLSTGHSLSPECYIGPRNKVLTYMLGLPEKIFIDLPFNLFGTYLQIEDRGRIEIIRQLKASGIDHAEKAKLINATMPKTSQEVEEQTADLSDENAFPIIKNIVEEWLTNTIGVPLEFEVEHMEKPPIFLRLYKRQKNLLA